MPFAQFSPEGVDAVIVTITGLVVAISGLVTAYAKLKSITTNIKTEMVKRDDHTDARVDLLWEAHLRRGEAGVISKKLADVVPPKGAEDITMTMVLHPEVRAAYAPIAATLRHIWVEVGRQAPKFVETLESRYAGWLQKHICIPLKVTDYECWAMARAVAEEEEEDEGATGTPDLPQQKRDT